MGMYFPEMPSQSRENCAFRLARISRQPSAATRARVSLADPSSASRNRSVWIGTAELPCQMRNAANQKRAAIAGRIALNCPGRELGKIPVALRRTGVMRLYSQMLGRETKG